MSYISKVNFTGASGRSYEFDAYTADHQFSDVGAVYVFSRQESTTYYSIYIGQTSELKTRLDGHEKLPCARRHNYNCICVLYDNNLTSRLSIERDLIRNGKPPCND